MVLGAVTSLVLAMSSAGFTRYVHSITRQASTLKFGIITTTGFTLSAGAYALGGDKNALTGAMLGSGTAALMAGMTTASAFRSRHPIPGAMAILSMGAIIIHFKILESIGLREKERREQELQSHPVSKPSSKEITPAPAPAFSSTLSSTLAQATATPTSTQSTSSNSSTSSENK